MQYSGTVLNSDNLLSIPELDVYVDKCRVQSGGHGGPGPNVFHINSNLSVFISQVIDSNFCLLLKLLEDVKLWKVGLDAQNTLNGDMQIKITSSHTLSDLGYVYNSRNRR